MNKLLWRCEVASEPVRLGLDEFIELNVLSSSDVMSVFRRGNVLFYLHIEPDVEMKVHYLDNIIYALSEEEGRYVYYDAEQGRAVFTDSYYGKALEDDKKKLLIVHVPPHPLYDMVLQAIKAIDSEVKVDL